MTTTEKVKGKRDRINPSLWRIIGQLNHKGVTYGRNEPLPEMTESEALAYERGGLMVRLNADGTLASEERVFEPSTADEFLSAPDLDVLLNCIKFRPSVHVLKEMVVLVRSSMRSKLLDAALSLAIESEKPRARTARQ